MWTRIQRYLVRTLSRTEHLHARVGGFANHSVAIAAGSATGSSRCQITLGRSDTMSGPLQWLGKFSLEAPSAIIGGRT
jgi:hypothetical protein